MILHLSAKEVEAHLNDLAEVLHACVAEGASVGFVWPHSLGEARAFWSEQMLPEIAAGTRACFVARRKDRVVGVVTLVTGMPGNQPHRAELSKLLVHPDQRRQGLAQQLTMAAEAHARRMGKRLITLDTRTGDSAEPLYRKLGYQRAGVIPEYCLDVRGTRFDSTTYMYKRLDPAEMPQR